MRPFRYVWLCLLAVYFCSPAREHGMNKSIANCIFYTYMKIQAVPQTRVYEYILDTYSHNIRNVYRTPHHQMPFRLVSCVVHITHNEVNSMGPNKNELVLCINTYLSIFFSLVFLLLQFSLHLFSSFVACVCAQNFSLDFPCYMFPLLAPKIKEFSPFCPSECRLLRQRRE